MRALWIAEDAAIRKRYALEDYSDAGTGEENAP
jgi:hypothetical protein